MRRALSARDLHWSRERADGARDQETMRRLNAFVLMRVGADLDEQDLPNLVVKLVHQLRVRVPDMFITILHKHHQRALRLLGILQRLLQHVLAGRLRGFLLQQLLVLLSEDV